MQRYKLKPILDWLFQPSNILLIITVLYFMLSLMHAIRIMQQSSEFEGLPMHWRLLDWMLEPFLLLVASLCLLLNRIWAYIVAMLVSGKIVYTVSHLGLLFMQTDFDGSRSEAMHLWVLIMRERMPREVFEITCGMVILLYAVVLIVARLRRGMLHSNGGI